MSFSYGANGRTVRATSLSEPPEALSVHDAAGMRVAEQVENVWRIMVMISAASSTPNTAESNPLMTGVQMAA